MKWCSWEIQFLVVAFRKTKQEDERVGLFLGPCTLSDKINSQSTILMSVVWAWVEDNLALIVILNLLFGTGSSSTGWTVKNSKCHLQKLKGHYKAIHERKHIIVLAIWLINGCERFYKQCHETAYAMPSWTTLSADTFVSFSPSTLTLVPWTSVSWTYPSLANPGGQLLCAVILSPFLHLMLSCC